MPESGRESRSWGAHLIRLGLLVRPSCSTERLHLVHCTVVHVYPLRARARASMLASAGVSREVKMKTKMKMKTAARRHGLLLLRCHDCGTRGCLHRLVNEGEEELTTSWRLNLHPGHCHRVRLETEESQAVLRSRCGQGEGSTWRNSTVTEN